MPTCSKRSNRQPTRTLTQSGYRVEVYSWMAGLPFRTRDYYAVYNQGTGKLYFATHYEFNIPPGELEPSKPRQEDSNASATAEATIPSGTEGPPAVGAAGDSKSGTGEASKSGGKKGKRKKDRDSKAGETSGDKASEATAPAADSRRRHPRLTPGRLLLRPTPPRRHLRLPRLPREGPDGLRYPGCNAARRRIAMSRHGPGRYCLLATEPPHRSTCGP